MNGFTTQRQNGHLERRENIIVIILLILLTTTILVIAIQLLSRLFTKQKSQRSSIFYPPSDLRGIGAWNIGALDTAEKLNESIAEGRARYTHTWPYRQRKHR